MTTSGSSDRPASSRSVSGSTGSHTGAHPTGTTAGHDVTGRMTGTHADHRVARTGDHDPELVRAKTSAAATFALVFGLAALFCALTAILSPAAVLFGLTGIVLGVVGLKMAKRPGVTGKGVAIGGLVTALLGLLIGGAVLAGLGVLVNDEQRLDQLQNRVDDLRADLPSTVELREELPS